MSKIGHTRWSRTVSGANWYSRRRSVRPFEDQELRREPPALCKRQRHRSQATFGRVLATALRRVRQEPSAFQRDRCSGCSGRPFDLDPREKPLHPVNATIKLRGPGTPGHCPVRRIVRCAEDYLAGCAIRATTYPNSPVNRDSTRRRCGLNDSTTTAAAQRPEARHNP
jgi:hypothetical protein